MKVKISPALVLGLRAAAALSRSIPDDAGPADEVAGSIAVALDQLADAGAPSSEGGRILTRGELGVVVRGLAVDLVGVLRDLEAGEALEDLAGLAGVALEELGASST